MTIQDFIDEAGKFPDAEIVIALGAALEAGVASVGMNEDGEVVLHLTDKRLAALKGSES